MSKKRFRVGQNRSDRAVRVRDVEGSERNIEK